MKKPSGAAPLFALNAVSLDLETTSLDASQARIVQIGALSIDHGAIAAPWDTLVDPGVAIPARSAAVHGVTTEMIRTARDIRHTWQALRKSVEGRVVIGHTIAYDLTVIENEAKRHGLEWERPRSLCIRTLAPIVLPELHNHSLDALAAWFDIPITNRHSALADAEAAAKVFLKMVPLLRERGINTLAEAERVTLQLSPHVKEAEQAGWVRPVATPGETVLTGGIAQYDTYAYRHSVADVMASPVIVLDNGTSVEESIRVMAKSAISSVLFASPAKDGEPIGSYAILTERDVLRRIAAKGAAALKENAGDIATRPLKAIRKDAFVYRAIARMRRFRIRHLAVVDNARNLVGMISARDMLKLRTDPAIALDDAINESTGAAGMAQAWATLPSVVSSLISERLDAHTITRIVSEEIRSMTGHAALLAEEAMRRDGLGEPPCPYAVMVLGSGGRGESLLKPDQDNAIIFEKGEAGGPEDQWFQELATRFAAILNEAGIPFCDGGVMAKNAQWRGSASLWAERVSEWVNQPRPENLLNVDIFYDQIPVHGTSRLAIDLFNKAYAAGSSNPVFAKMLGAQLESLSNPFGMFGRIRAENNKLDLKLHVLFPVVAAARTLSIRHNIPAHSTRERLESLAALEKGDVGLIARLVRGHAFALSLMLRSQEREVATGRKPTNFIDLSALSAEETTSLKALLSDIRYVPNLVRDLMF